MKLSQTLKNIKLKEKNWYLKYFNNYFEIYVEKTFLEIWIIN